MRRNRIGPLGETEMEVLRHVWALGEASVADVRERVLASREVAYTTVMTVMKKLADKGYLAYRKDGASYVYRPAKPPERVRGSLLGGFLDTVFGGSREALVQTLLRDEPLSAQERDAIRALLDKHESPAPEDPDSARSDD